jgi:hypothetical protein
MEDITITAGGLITIPPEDLYRELDALKMWDRWAREKEICDWTEILITDLSALFTHLSGSDKIGNESGPRIRFIAQCLRYLNPSADELIGPVEVETIKTPSKIRKLLIRRH